MSKIVIMVDTEDEEAGINVSVDGTVVENVHSASVSTYKDYDGDMDLYVSICSMEELEGMRKSIYLVNAASKEGKELVKNFKAVSSKKLVGFVERTDNLSPVQKSIVEFMTKKK